MSRKVGILAIDAYFPRTAVRQADLETFDKAPQGKYLVGLGQNSMAFVGDKEDVISIALTAVANFLERFNISPADIGRLDVGTETLLDKSKSVKTYLMTLFGSNTNVEGADHLNACYGGTDALLGAFNWVESNSWDGRFALVVAADVAVYEAGPARPTGGCGAVVMLVGPNAPLVFERGQIGSHAEHAYDFYKPIHDKEYPVVEGKLSQECYIRSVDKCYQHYRASYAKNNPGARAFSMDDSQNFVFHAPYNKLVQQGYARMLFCDFLSSNSSADFSSVQRHRGKTLESTYIDRDVTTDFVQLSKSTYQQKVVPSTAIPTEIGNTYCASLYVGLLSLLVEKQDALVGQRIMLFSYGSGALSTLFSLHVASSLARSVKPRDVREILERRTFVTPEEFTAQLARNEVRYTSVPYQTVQPVEQLAPGTFYLTHIDDLFRRFYQRVPPRGAAKL